MATLGIVHIAALAEVSIATVSRTFREPERVSEKTREKILRIVDEVGYSPNRMAVSLRTRQSGNILAIVPDITNPVNTSIIKSIEHIAQKNGYVILLGDTQGVEARERHYANLVDSGQADGILLFCSRIPFKVNPYISLLNQLPPLVSGNERVNAGEVRYVGIDNVAAAKAATEYLLSLGHAEIAVVAGPVDIPSCRERMAGYKQALIQAGLSYDDSLVFWGGYDVYSGEYCVRQLLSLSQRPTAIFCFNDDMAIGVMRCLQKQGISIPKDISVMGFDDIDYARFVRPSLTTVHQPMGDIGSECINLLLEQLKGEPGALEDKFLPFELKIRESTGKPP